MGSPTTRPGWVMGPFPSAYGAAINFDKLVCVATGIGITPALAIMQKLKGNRSVSVIWTCREPDILEHYLSALNFDEKAWTLIYYTGKENLSLTPDIFDTRPRLRLFRGRCQFEDVIASIISSIEYNEELRPEMI